MDPLEKIYSILAERTRVEKEFRQAEQQFRKVAEEAIHELKSTIVTLCEAAGTTISDLFGGGTDTEAPAAAPAAPAKRGRKPKAEAPVPAKRGRKPKAEVAAAPAKRGRKPKAEAPAPAKRGRKPKVEGQAPAKRGRPRKTEVAASAPAASETVAVQAKAGKSAKSAESAKASKPAKRASRKASTSGPGKYVHNGMDYDGRQARAMAAFDAVRVDGKIDDAKALEAGMVNPAWLATKSVASRKFVDDFGLDVLAYTMRVR